jgi:ketosteroid isomerase-like protein
MKKTWIALIAAALLIPLGMWWFSPEQVVMRRTKHLMEVLSLDEGMSRPFRQAKVLSMNALLAPEVELVIPEIADANGSFDRQEIESAFSWICQNAKDSRFDVTAFRNVDVKGDKATVTFLAEGYLELGSGRPADGTSNVTVVWKKGGDGWRYEKVVWKKP